MIAGTEPITEWVLARAHNLKLISRVGIGLDSVDLVAAERRGIRVVYTPDAPAPAVAELTVALILSLLRSVHVCNLRDARRDAGSGIWAAVIAEVTLGIIGAGRVGRRVLRRDSRRSARLSVLVNDIVPNLKLVPELKLEWVAKEEIYRDCRRHQSACSDDRTDQEHDSARTAPADEGGRLAGEHIPRRHRQ